MAQDFVESLVRRSNLKLLIFCFLGFFALCIGFILGFRYLLNMFLGPEPINNSDVIALTNAGSRFRYFVTITGSDHASTGYQYISTSSSGKETIEAYYNALLIDNRFLLVKSDTDEIQNTMTGALVNIPGDLNTQVISQLENEMPNIKGAFLPVMLDTSNFYTPGYVSLAVAAIVAIFTLIGFFLAVSRFLNPLNHPALKSYARFGDVNLIVNTINTEISSQHELIGKKVHFTKNWIVSTANVIEASPYRDLIWCYKSVIQHRTNGIPTGKTYAVNVYDRTGKNITIPGKEPEVDQILNLLILYSPGIIAGYSSEIQQFFKNDRLGFIAAVDKRRQK